jgi:hypothetical protein
LSAPSCCGPAGQLARRSRSERRGPVFGGLGMGTTGSRSRGRGCWWRHVTGRRLLGAVGGGFALAVSPRRACGAGSDQAGAEHLAQCASRIVVRVGGPSRRSENRLGFVRGILAGSTIRPGRGLAGSSRDGVLLDAPERRGRGLAETVVARVAPVRRRRFHSPGAVFLRVVWYWEIGSGIRPNAKVPPMQGVGGCLATPIVPCKGSPFRASAAQRVHITDALR